MSEQLLKGAAAEEALRNYFLSIGFFVARGCLFKYNQFDVTDVDLWLYGKSSALSRERLNVDIKNKKTPQALERIFWAKGLQFVLGVEGCIVATTDQRPDVREFGLKHQVRVLDGSFLSRLTKSSRSHLQRITEEQFFEQIDSGSMGKLGGDWKGRYEKSKSRLLDSLTFDGCNAWLIDIGYFFEQLFCSTSNTTPAWRMIYTACSHLVVAIDFILRDHVAIEPDQQKTLLEDGFRYGSAGKLFTEKVGEMISALADSVAAQPGIADTINHELREQAASVRAEILAEFLSQRPAQRGLFDAARELEAAAFAIQPPMPSNLSASVQSLLGVLADFFGFDRKRIIV